MELPFVAPVAEDAVDAGAGEQEGDRREGPQEDREEALGGDGAPREARIRQAIAITESELRTTFADRIAFDTR